MEKNFQIGDVVCLNSAPKVAMTVYNVTINGTVATKYFNYRKNPQIETFNPNELKLIERFK